MSDSDPKALVDSQSWAYQVGRWWRGQPPQVRWAAAAFAVIVLIVAIGAALESSGRDNKPSDTIAMPASSSELEGENYNDVVTRLKTAGFASVETTSIDDLITGWLTKDGEVERVSVDGETDFEAGGRFPKGAKIVITYHTFPVEEPDEVAESEPAEAETAEREPAEVEAPESIPAEVEAPESAPRVVDNTILTAQNSTELKAVLNAEDPGDPMIKAFIAKYAGRTIEFDGYTWDWYTDNSGTTCIWVGNYEDIENPNVSKVGPTFRVEGFHMPDSSPPPARKNVHVRAVVDSWDEDHTYIRISPISLKAR